MHVRTKNRNKLEIQISRIRRVFFWYFSLAVLTKCLSSMPRGEDGEPAGMYPVPYGRYVHSAVCMYHKLQKIYKNTYYKYIFVYNKCIRINHKCIYIHTYVYVYGYIHIYTYIQCSEISLYLFIYTHISAICIYANLPIALRCIYLHISHTSIYWSAVSSHLSHVHYIFMFVVRTASLRGCTQHQ